MDKDSEDFQRMISTILGKHAGTDEIAADLLLQREKVAALALENKRLNARVKRLSEERDSLYLSLSSERESSHKQLKALRWDRDELLAELFRMDDAKARRTPRRPQ